MRVLAIDTALEACSAAVLDTDRGEITASETLSMARGHAEAVMPLIARVMGAAGIEFADLDRIAVTTGPGSFTGLRVGISAARGIALAAGKPAIGLSTLAGFAAPLIADDDSTNVVAAIDARHDHVYLQVFGTGGRTLVAPRIATLRDAVRAAMTGPARIVGSAANQVAAAWPKGAEPPLAGRAARRARYRLDRAARRRRRGRPRPAEAALPARARRPAAGRRAPAPPMIGDRQPPVRAREPVLSEAGPRDARALAALHGASFHRGWSDGEFERLLFDRNVVAHRATVGRSLVGFILSRLVLDEAEILSVAVAASRRGRGLARRLLDLHLRRLAGLGARTVFLEVDEGNVPARRLYRRAGFRDVGRREGYYPPARAPPRSFSAAI